MNRKKKESKNGEDDNGFAEWGGYMAAKKLKLLEQFHDAANNINKESNIFNGIAIFVNGYTNPTAEELKRIMALNGGEYHYYYKPAKTTYIIASNLPDTKIKQMGPNQKIIKPDWITDCLKAGKVLDYSSYLLYTNCNRKQPKLNFEKVNKEESKFTVDKEEEEFSPEIFGSYENKSNVDSKLFEIENKTILEKPSRTLTANDPKFLTEFYNNSRLHHISTLGATFKQHICDLREQSDFKFPARQKFVNYLEGLKREKIGNFSVVSKQTVIMHIDMDCFFVSVGLRKRPELRGMPVAVTHSKGGQEPGLRSGVDRQAELDCYRKRIQEKFSLKNTELGPGNMMSRLNGIENQSMSEIASCSYEARKAGVKNGMFMGTALKLCPNLQTISYDFEGYKDVAFTLYNTLSEYTLNIEAVSCDEMFVDITELLNESGATVNEWATYIRSLIQDRTGCPCSTGFGQNRLQARVATKTAKPNGQFYLIPDAVEEYMVDIKVDDLPGVGRTTSLKLESFGVRTCGDLQSMPIGQLRSEFGNKIGESLYNHCRGIDDRKLVYEHERKSVSAEVNYGIRFKSNTEAETFLKQLIGEVHSRLTEIKMKGKSITLKLMVRSKDAPEESSKFMGHGICDYITKSNTLSVATNELNIIEREILSIAQKLSVPPQDLRGIGIQISKLEKSKNISGGISKFFNNFKTETLIDDKKNGENINVKLSPIKNYENINVKLSPIKNNENIVKLSPIKNNGNINAKLSPIKNTRLSTTRRGRGRPRGSRGGKTIERKNSNNGNLTKYLATPNTTALTIQKQIQLDGIDMEVFEALPEDIRNEIFAAYQSNNYSDNLNLESPTKETRNPDIVDKTKIATAPETPEIQSIPSTSKEEKEEDKNCMFSKMNIKQMKGLLENWICSQNHPEVCDIAMIGKYFKHLALEKKIGNLFEILKFLFSEISIKNDCEWHKAYFEIVNIAQEGMMTNYGSRIYVYKDFKCKNMCRLDSR